MVLEVLLHRLISHISSRQYLSVFLKDKQTTSTSQATFPGLDHKIISERRPTKNTESKHLTISRSNIVSMHENPHVRVEHMQPHFLLMFEMENNKFKLLIKLILI